MADLIKAALALATRRLAVFPLKPRDKTPITKNGCKDATTDLDVVRAWWEGWPDCNIAIATGAISGVWVLDIDGEDGESSLRAIEQEHGRTLPATVEVITGSGGRHLYFKLPDLMRQQSATAHPRSAPGSIWLVDLVTKDNVTEPDRRRPTEHWAKILRDGVPEGARNETTARLAGWMLRMGLSPQDTLEILLAWNATRCRPPEGDAVIAAVVSSIADREARRRGW